MSELYLILHKVRGEPAFDIAERMEIEVGGETETWWIIPTSGHRAYPHRYWQLDNLIDDSDINNYMMHERPAMLDEIPDDLPDHYEHRPEPTFKPTVERRTILQRLGIIKPKPQVEIRRL